MRLAWLYVVVGSVDLVYALYLGFANEMWLSFGPVWLIVILLAPVLTVAMGLVPVLLLKHPERAKTTT